MKNAPLAEVKDRLSAYIDESRESPIIVARDDRSAVMLIAIEAEDDLDNLPLVHEQRFLRMLKEAHARVRATGGASLAEMRQQVGG